jgi:hypothetical protein
LVLSQTTWHRFEARFAVEVDLGPFGDTESYVSDTNAVPAVCASCGRDMEAGELHTADCPSALEQDAMDSGGGLEKEARIEAARQAFSSFGELIEAALVPDLVRAGREVWSFGYGAELAVDEFTVINAADLWAFEGALEGSAGWVDPDPAVVASWAPFRVARAKATPAASPARDAILAELRGAPFPGAMADRILAALSAAGVVVLNPSDIDWGVCPDRDPDNEDEDNRHHVSLGLCAFCLKYDPD